MRACGCCVWLRERGMVGDSTCRVLAKMPSLEKKVTAQTLGALCFVLGACGWRLRQPNVRYKAWGGSRVAPGRRDYVRPEKLR